MPIKHVSKVKKTHIHIGEYIDFNEKEPYTQLWRFLVIETKFKKRNEEENQQRIS